MIKLFPSSCKELQQSAGTILKKNASGVDMHEKMWAPLESKETLCTSGKRAVRD